MAFEIQELLDVIRVIVLLNLSKDAKIKKSTLKNRIDKVCVSYTCVNMSEVEKSLKEMSSEGLIREDGELIQLTPQGQKLGKEWESLLLKKEPIMEVVAGLVDGSVTSLVVILSAFIATLRTTSKFLGNQNAVVFAAFLTLSAVAITNFPSFLLGGITEDLADIMTLQTLMNYSLSDIPDKKERDKSLILVQKLFTLLGKTNSPVECLCCNNLWNYNVCCRNYYYSNLPVSTTVLQYNNIISSGSNDSRGISCAVSFKKKREKTGKLP